MSAPWIKNLCTDTVILYEVYSVTARYTVCKENYLNDG